MSSQFFVGPAPAVECRPAVEVAYADENIVIFTNGTALFFTQHHRAMHDATLTAAKDYSRVTGFPSVVITRTR